MAVDRRLINILLLSLGFLFVYLGSMSNIVKVVYSSIHAEDPNFTVDGYYALAIQYIVFAMTNWFTPAIIAIIGPKYTLIIASITFIVYAGVVLIPQTALVYVASGFNGFGVSLLWISHGVLITINSDEKTISKNAGIFWAIMQSSKIPGQIFLFLEFRNTQLINKQKRSEVFSVLAIAAGLSIPVFFAIKIIEGTYKKDLGPLTAFKRSFTLLTEKTMLFLLLPFIYSGLIQSFDFGVCGAAIGFTMKFGDQAKGYMALSLLFFGVGSVTGGSILGIISSKIKRFGRYPIFIAGIFVFLLAFLLTFLNLSKDSPLMETDSDAIITTTVQLAMFCAFLLGIGDSCVNTQIISIISVLFVEDCSSAFALYRFFFATVGAISLIYSSHLNLYWQLAIMCVFGIFSAISFSFVERVFKKEKMKRLIDDESDKNNATV